MVRPPLERPIAWLCVPFFCTLPVAVDFDDGRVDQGVFHVRLVRDGLEQPLPDVRLHPVAKAGEDAGQFPNEGGRSRGGLPVRTIHSTASTKRRLSLPLRPGVARLAPTTRFHLRPLGVRQHKAVHPRRKSQPSTDEKRESQQTLGGEIIETMLLRSQPGLA